MRRTFRRFTAAVCLLGGLFLFPTAAAAQKALVYCPTDDATGCAGVAAALTSAYADGVDRGYDGSGGTIDLAAADLSGYAVFVVPSLADDETVQPYARLRDSAVAERLRGLVTGRVAVWSGTPDLGTSNRDKKDALLRNLAGWARADTEAGRGAGLVALLDASGEGQYGWLGGISGATVGAGSAFDVYANVEVKTSTGTTILSSGGLQLGYTAMAQGALTSNGGTVDATGGRTTNAVLVTFAVAPGDGSIATITTDKEDYAPGETVTITGTGWEPGETVSMKLHEEPLVHGDRTLSAVADVEGNFVNASFTVEEHDLGVRFVLTATGQTSGRTAQATFTDGRVVTSATLNGASSVTVAPGASITASVTVTITAAGNVDWGSTRWTVGTVTACMNHGNHTGANSNFTESFTITAPNTAGAYDAVFEAFSNDNCGGTGGGNTPITLVNGVTVATANQPPLADAGGPYTGSEGSAVTLSGSATDDGPQASLTYAWTYAAGAGVDAGASCAFSPSAAVASPSVTCTDDGSFTLTLTVTDADGANDTDTATLTLQNVPATANAGGPYTGAEGTAIPLLGTGSDAGANDAAGLTYAWSVNTSGIDAGGTCTIANPAQPNTTVTCTDDGAFSVSLLVTDGDAGASTPSQTTLTVGNAVPVADAGGPYSGTEGTPVQLAGAGNDPGDNDDATLTYQWTAITTGIDAGGACTFDDATNQNAEVTCTDDGAFKLRLVATDDDGGSSVAAEADLTIGNAAPVADAGGPYAGVEGAPVALEGSVQDAGPNDSPTWSWDYIDGAGIDGGTCAFSDVTDLTPTVTCTDDGTVQLTLTVSDGDGGEHTDQATLTLTNADPVADAGGVNSTYSGAEGSAVQLNGTVTDAGSNDTHVWSWAYVGTNVDPGASCSFTNAAAQDPSITCTDDGTVELTLTVTDDDGGSDTDTATLTLTNAAPVANAGDNVSGDEGSAVVLSGSATDPGLNDALSFLWAVNDDGISSNGSCTLTNPTSATAQLTCTDNGTATVTLTVTDDDGSSDSDEATVTIQNVAPVANAGGTYSGSEGAPVSLDGEVTDAGANDTHTWSWAYIDGAGIDGGSCSFSDPNDEDPTVTCTDDGTVQLTLTVTDDDGASDSDTATLTLANVAPVASTGGPYAGDEGSTIPLMGSGDDQGDNDNAGLTYEWSVATTGIDAGGACSVADETATNTTITCTDDGVFTLTLTVRDDDGGVGTDDVQLTVNNVAPVADAGTGYTGNEGEAVQLTGSIDDAGANDTHVWSWSYTGGAGIDGGTCSFSDAADLTPTVTCTDDGTVELTLTVTDDDGASHTDTATLTLDNVDPVADAGGLNSTYSGAEGSAIQLNGTVTDAGINDSHTWSWQYVGTAVDPGAACTFTSATAEDPKITCTDDGIVELTLTVTDDDGGTDMDKATLTLTNVAPVASAGGPYSGTEGASIAVAGSATDAGSNDDFTYEWTLDDSGIDGSGSCSIADPTSASTSITCTDNGSVSLALEVTDDDGASHTSTTTLTVQNANPVASAGGPYAGQEGAAVTLSGSATDAGADELTYLWSVDAGGIEDGGTCTLSNPTSASASVTCSDNGTATLTLTVSDDDGGSGTSTSVLTLSNVAPILSAITAPAAPVAINTPVAVSAAFTDQGTNDTHVGTINWGDGSTAALITEANGSGTAGGTHAYANPGVYTITLTVTDDEGAASNTEEFQYVVVYDPNGGFVTGGGWIMSQPGMYLPDVSLSGKANFGFVSKYQKGATVPTGNTEFQFHAGDLNFRSASYEWLVVQGKDKASYKGVGSINGEGDYGFLLSVIDGGSTGDRFRIKIWDRANGDAVVYDNQVGAADDASATTALGGGSIVVHTPPAGKVAAK